MEWLNAFSSAPVREKGQGLKGLVSQWPYLETEAGCLGGKLTPSSARSHTLEEGKGDLPRA